MSSRGATLGVSLALAIGLGVGGSQLTVPYVGLGPGPVFNTLGTSGGAPLIQVPKDRDHPAGGELDLTTVNVYPRLTLGQAIGKWFDRRFAVVPRDVVYPPDQSEQESEQETQREMTESQEHAVTAALCELGTPILARVVIDAVGDGTPAAAAGVKVGDVVTTIDGGRVDSVCALRRLVARHQPGDTIRLGYRRGGTDGVASIVTRAGETGGSDGRPVMGVGLKEQEPRPPFPVTIALNDVGGPSAGLMFALGIYDRLTPGDLTGGKVIAGTGSIDDDGAVGPIGGIQQKLVAARAHGAAYFLTPSGNWDDAVKATPKGLHLVRVSTLREALAAVRAIARGATPR
ncbi:MAG TPA: PDZ domain-containing protein [Mycobacteriales bacterium]|jgi:PDZ domain-containing protein|nr:PDZ domain-containing protein [Mycobacteriales bacterium]